jgi:hypothetical protein
MKKYIALTALLCSTAHAQFDTPVVATMNNMGKGKIVLLDEPCETDKTKVMKRAFYYTRDNHTSDGCWKVDAGTVVIHWENDGKRRYPFDLLQYNERKFR